MPSIRLREIAGARFSEKAYAQLQNFGDLTGNGKKTFGSSYASIGNGGIGVFALEELTGSSKIDDFMFSSKSLTTILDLNYSASQITPGRNSATTYTTTNATQLSTEIATALSMGNDVLVSSRSNTYVNGKQNLVSDHQFAVYGIDKDNGKLQLRNPWGVQGANQGFNTTFEVSLNDLISAGDEVIIDTINGAYSSRSPVDPQSNSAVVTPTKSKITTA